MSKKLKFSAPRQSDLSQKNINLNKVRDTYQRPQISEGVSFSFRYLQLDDPLFARNNLTQEWLIDLLERKKNLCTMTFCELKMGGRAIRCHPIKFQETKKPDGFGVSISQDIAAFQIGVGQTNGRVHGFFLGDIFYVVWLDPEHNLYS